MPFAEISAAERSPAVDESSRLATVHDQSEPLATTGGAETTEAELKAAIVRAVTMGLGEVAHTLALSLEARRRGPNVVALPSKFGRRS